jgi:cyclic pyranopterin phosphate synthase
MVDVSAKQASEREAVAETFVWLPAVVREAFGDGELATRKGPVFATAIIAGVMAAKRTHELIPFCHPLGLTGCDVDISREGEGVRIRCRCRVRHRTGVEMEALTGASVAALTVYDMCKALSHEIEIRETRLVSKRGGKSDYARG